MCRRKSRGEWEGEDRRRAWLINLFTSLKMLQAPFWLKFTLSSITAMAALNLQRCRYQALSQHPASILCHAQHPPTANPTISPNIMICMSSFRVTSWLVRNPPLYIYILSFPPHMLRLDICFSLSPPPAVPVSVDSRGWCLCVCLLPPVTFLPNLRLLAPQA